MKKQPTINISGTNVSSEIEDEVSRWYKEVHAPRLIKTGLVKQANRYRLISGDGREYLRWLGVYNFDSYPDFAKYNSDPSIFNALRTLRRQKFPDEAFDVRWYAAYSLSNMPLGETDTEQVKPVIFITGISVTSEIEADVTRWYDEEQAPRLLASGLIKSARRYRFMSGDGREYPDYLAIYGFDSLQDMEQWRSDPEMLLHLRVLRQQMFPDGAYRVLWNAAYRHTCQVK